MKRSLSNIFWLGTKELRAVAKEPMMILFIIWSFGLNIYTQSTGAGETVNNAAIAVVDEDNSALSRSIAGLFYPPYFQIVKNISSNEIDQSMDDGLFTVVIVIPPGFEKDVVSGRNAEVQVDVDATASQQAALATGYIQRMIITEVSRFQSGTLPVSASTLELRRAFNPNGTQSWFRAVVGLADQLSMLMIILTGAALLREREHGTIEHLMVMPLNAYEIALAKVWANGLLILMAFTGSLVFIVQGILDVPIAGSKLLLMLGTIIYIFAAAAIGIFLGMLAQTMAQFALLMLMFIFPMMILSGGMLPVESQPDWVQKITWFLPSRHYISIVQAIAVRGGGLSTVWQEFIIVFAMGGTFLIASLRLFRRSMAT